MRVQILLSLHGLSKRKHVGTHRCPYDKYCALHYCLKTLLCDPTGEQTDYTTKVKINISALSTCSRSGSTCRPLPKTPPSPSFHHHSKPVRHTSSSNMGTATRVYSPDVLEPDVSQPHRHQPRVLQRRLEAPRSRMACCDTHSLSIPSQTARYMRLSKGCSRSSYACYTQ